MVDFFYAFGMPIRGTVRFFVQQTHGPERFRIGLKRALPPWKDIFSFYAYMVPWGKEHIYNTPKLDAL